MPLHISLIQLHRLRDSLPLYRKILGYSAEELGSYMGLTRQQMSSLETGRTKLAQVHLRAISDIINEIISETEESMLDIGLFVILVLLKSNEEDIDDEEYSVWKNILTQYSNIKEKGAPENQIKLLKGFAIASRGLKKGDVVPTIEVLDKIFEVIKNSKKSLENIVEEQ